jgi:hypothetical protein
VIHGYLSALSRPEQVVCFFRNVVAVKVVERHFPIHKIFERSCELGLWRLSVDKISEVFGQRGFAGPGVRRDDRLCGKGLVAASCTNRTSRAQTGQRDASRGAFGSPII